MKNVLLSWSLRSPFAFLVLFYEFQVIMRLFDNIAKQPLEMPKNVEIGDYMERYEVLVLLQYFYVGKNSKKIMLKADLGIICSVLLLQWNLGFCVECSRRTQTSGTVRRR